MKKHHLLALVILAAFVCGVASGCGGSEAATVQLTKKQFLKKGDEICSDAETEQFEAGGRYGQKHPNVEEKDLVVPVVLPPIEKEIVKLKALGAPAGDETKINDFITALETAIADAKEDPMDVLISQRDPFKEPDKLASEYGFNVCANNP